MIKEGDAARLDQIYQSTIDRVSSSYIKVCDLFEGGNVSEAASKFKAEFVSGVNELSSQLGKTAPGRYIGDAKWTIRMKDLKTLTERAQKSLEDGDVESSRKALRTLRNFFYYLHTSNGIELSNVTDD